MPGISEQLVGRGDLHHVAQIHNADPVGNVADDGQVMGNEQIGQAVLLLQLLQQVDNLGLNGHVQSGHALVTHHELGLHGKGTGDADTLPLTAGELVGIAVVHIVLQAALVHRLEDVGLHPLGAALEELVGDQTFLDNLTHGHPGVQGGIGILEDDLQILPQKPHFLVLQALQIHAVVQHGLILLELRVGSVLGALSGKYLLRFLSGGHRSLVKIFQLVDLHLMALDLLFAGGGLLGLILGDALQHFDLHMVLVDLSLQRGSTEGMAVPVQQQRRALVGVLHHEAAQNLGSVIKCGLGVAGGQVLILNVKERRFVPQRVALLGHFLGVGNGLVVIRHVLIGIFQGVQHILRRDGIQRPSVVHRAAGSLFVQLQEHTS